jgi:hypothetical protein
MERVTKISISLLVLMLTICLRTQANQIVATLGAGSTPGDLSGTLSLSFNSRNRVNYNDGTWGSVQAQPVYSVPGAAISLDFSAFSEDPNGLTFLASFDFSDARIGSPSFTFSLWPAFSSGVFVPGQSTVQDLTFNSGNTPLYDYDNIGPAIGTIDFSYTLPVNFNGTTGHGVGTWSLTYTVAAANNVPDGGSTMLLLGIALFLLGGFGILRPQQADKSSRS